MALLHQILRHTTEAG